MTSEKTPYKAIQERLNKIAARSPLSQDQIDEAADDILSLVREYFVSPDVLSERYEGGCRAFLSSAKNNKGLPFHAVLSTDDSRSGEQAIPEPRDVERLWPLLDDLLAEVVARYRVQASDYYSASVDEFMAEANEFLTTLDSDVTDRTAVKNRIRLLCQSFRTTMKWSSTFDALKNGCFPQVVSNTFSANSGAIAAQWRYNTLDEDVDYSNHDHRHRDGKVYPIRGNWAGEKGLLARDVTYLDEVSMDLLDVGCCCHLLFLFSPDRLTDSLLSDKGRVALEGSRGLADLGHGQAAKVIAPASDPAAGAGSGQASKTTMSAGVMRTLLRKIPWI